MGVKLVCDWVLQFIASLEIYCMALISRNIILLQITSFALMRINLIRAGSLKSDFKDFEDFKDFKDYI